MPVYKYNVGNRLPTPHCLRRSKPLDNVASLKRRFGDLDLSTERWLIDKEALLAQQKRDGIMTITYEALVSKDNRTLTEVLDFLSLSVFSAEELEAAIALQTLAPRHEDQTIRYSEVTQDMQNKIGVSAAKLSDAARQRALDRTTALAQHFGHSKDLIANLGGRS